MFKVGDVVKLKSGGPDMTIAEITESNGRTEYLCKWFSKNNEVETAIFTESMLKAPPEPRFRAVEII